MLRLGLLAVALAVVFQIADGYSMDRVEVQDNNVEVSESEYGISFSDLNKTFVCDSFLM